MIYTTPKAAIIPLYSAKKLLGVAQWTLYAHIIYNYIYIIPAQSLQRERDSTRWTATAGRHGEQARPRPRVQVRWGGGRGWGGTFQKIKIIFGGVLEILP